MAEHARGLIGILNNRDDKLLNRTMLIEDIVCRCFDRSALAYLALNYYYRIFTTHLCILSVNDITSNMLVASFFFFFFFFFLRLWKQSHARL